VEEGSAQDRRRHRVCGWSGEGGEVVAVGRLLMDLSRRGQSRDAEGRHRAARPGLGTRVGARVASPRCPILRPGSSSVFGTAAIWQFRAGSPACKTGRKDSPGIARRDREDEPGSSPPGGLSARCGVRCLEFFNYHIIIYSI
jgi:hypothetical protein